MEEEENHQLPFLDVLDNGQSEYPVTSVFRKKAYTVLLTNSFVLHPVLTNSALLAHMQIGPLRSTIPEKVFMKT